MQLFLFIFTIFDKIHTQHVAWRRNECIFFHCDLGTDVGSDPQDLECYKCISIMLTFRTAVCALVQCSSVYFDTIHPRRPHRAYANADVSLI